MSIFLSPTTEEEISGLIMSLDSTKGSDIDDISAKLLKISCHLAERFQSIVHHVVNKHSWPGCTYFKNCAHEDLDDTAQRRVKWMKRDSVAHQEFKKIILHFNVKKDLLQMAGGVHTTLLEVYHSVITKYLPKIYHFEFDRMEVGTMLAALDNNYNTGRDQKKMITPGKGLKLSVRNYYRVAYRKPTKKFIARKFYNKKDYLYLRTMLAEQ